MLKLRIGIQLASLRQPLKTGLQTAARLGADGVEIDLRGEVRPQELNRTAVRHLRKMLTDLNLTVCAARFQTRRGFDIEDDLDRRIDATKQAMKAAFDLGARVLINQIGRISPDEESDTQNVMVQSLADLGMYGQHVGCLFAARTGTEDGPTLKQFINRLPQGCLSVDFDPGSLIIHGFSPNEAIKALGPDVVHFHARDGVQDLAQGRGLEVQLGRGSMDLPYLLGVLEEHQYQGFLTVEREHAQDPVLEISQSVQYLRSLW